MRATQILFFIKMNSLSESNTQPKQIQNKTRYTLLLYILIVTILIVFLAATITLIAKQFAKKISTEGYTQVPQ